MSALYYCDMCKRYHERGLCNAERMVGVLTGSTAFAVQLMERDQRINEAARWLQDTTLGTPQERALKAVEILKGIPSSGNGEQNGH